jgi:3-methylcrotonyl-CoA carboxylase alpha subunit
VSGSDVHWQWNGAAITEGQAIPFRILERMPDGIRIAIEGRNHELYTWRDGRVLTVWCDGKIYRLERVEKRRSATHDVHAVGEIRAPMAGKVLQVEVAVGTEVAEQQPVLVLESMKMETSINAPRAGRVAQILVQPGNVVDMGQLLMVIE